MTALPLVGLGLFSYGEHIDQLPTGDFTVYCRECMTFLTYDMTTTDVENLQTEPFDYNIEKSNIIKLKEEINILKKEPKTWNYLGYAGVMHLDWCSTLLEVLPTLEMTTSKNQLYFLVYNRLKNSIPEYLDEIAGKSP